MLLNNPGVKGERENEIGFLKNKNRKNKLLESIGYN